MKKNGFPEQYFIDDDQADIEAADERTRLLSHEHVVQTLEIDELERRIILSEVMIKTLSESKRDVQSTVSHCMTFMLSMLAFYGAIGTLMAANTKGIPLVLVLSALLFTLVLMGIQKIIIMYAGNVDKSVWRYEIYLGVLKKQLARENKVVCAFSAGSLERT